MSPARFSAALSKVRMIEAHAATIQANNPVMDAELARHIEAMKAYAASVAADLQGMRNDAQGEAPADLRTAAVIDMPTFLRRPLPLGGA